MLTHARLSHVLALFLLLICCVIPALAAPRTVAPIYPLEHAIQVDGKITDWEWAPTLGIDKFAMPIDIPDVGTVARFWARFDTQFLYVAFRVNDASPAMNKRLNRVRWEGDQVELLLCTDPQNHEKHASFGAYDYQLFIGPDDEKHADVYVNINKARSDYLLPDSQAAIQVWADGKGYDVEAKIAWSSLNHPEYFQLKAGVEIGWQIQVDFGTADGTRFEHAVKWYPFGIHFQNPSSWAWARFLGPAETLFAPEPVIEQPRPPIGSAEVSWTNPAAGKVSVNVIRADGTLVRRLAVGAQMAAGPQMLTWDGYDEDGNPAPAGAYRVIGSVANLGVTYLTTVGNTSPEPYGGCRAESGGEYRHGAWYDTIMNPDGSFYILNVGGEGPPAIQLIDPKQNYRVVWGGDAATAGSEFANVGARDENYLYLGHGTRMSRMDARTHKSVRFANGQWMVPMVIDDNKDGLICGMGAYRGKVFVPLEGASRVDIYDGEKGEKIGAITDPQLHGPRDVWVTGDGTLYIIDKYDVHRFSLDGKYLDSPVRNLTDGYSVAVAGDGRIFVGEMNRHAVTVYSAQGKPLRVMGKDSPVTSGPFFNGWGLVENADGFNGKVKDDSLFRPAGIAVDAAGNLVVVDPGIALTGYYDARGRLQKRLVSEIYAALLVDPAHPETVYISSEGPPMVRQYAMNWKTGAHTLQAIYTPTPRVPCGTQFMKFHNGLPYFNSGGSVVWTIEKGRVRLCSRLGGGPTVPVFADGKASTIDLRNDPAWKDKAPGGWEWRDANRDGLPQLAEYTVYPASESKPYWSFAYPHNYYVGDDWAVQGKVNENREGQYIRVPLSGFDKAGNPIYEWKNCKLVFEGAKIDAKWTADLSGGNPKKPSLGGVNYTDDGWTFLVLNDRPGFNPEDCRFRAYAPDGTRMFSICHGTKGFFDKPGVEISFCMQIAGVLDDAVFVDDVPAASHVFTRDGLYLGTLCNQGDMAPAMKGTDMRYQPQGEMWYAHVFRHPKTKKAYLIAEPNAAPLVMVYEITGLNAVQRFTGGCTLVLNR